MPSRVKAAGLARGEPACVLVYRLQSLGDSVAALPCLHLVRRTWPSARRVLLTNLPREREVHGSTVLKPGGLVDEFVDYPVHERRWSVLARLHGRLRRLRPDVLVYLAAFRGAASVWRDAAFFASCGIRRMVGVPWTTDLQRRRHLGAGLHEAEAARLARTLAGLGDAALDSSASWDIGLDEVEALAAETALGPVGHLPFLAAAVGSKVPAKDWGAEAWRAWAVELSPRLPGTPLVLVGAAEDRERSAAVAELWRGPSLNLCGRVTVRGSAAVLGKAAAFVGTDGGAMHLAAALGTPCAVIFSDYNRPGEWYPSGSGHIILHPRKPADVGAAEFADAAAKLVAAGGRSFGDLPGATATRRAGRAGNAGQPSAKLARSVG